MEPKTRTEEIRERLDGIGTEAWNKDDAELLEAYLGSDGVFTTEVIEILTHAPNDIHWLLGENERLGYQKNVLQKDIDRMQERLQASPFGDDKIDELEEALDNWRHQFDGLKAENAQLRQRNAQLERERDAAVAKSISHLPGLCHTCVHSKKEMHEEPCCNCKDLFTDREASHWQWRNVQEEGGADGTI